MKLSVIDQVGLLLALFFIIGGLLIFFRPEDLVFLHSVGNLSGGIDGELNYVTRAQARVFGGISVVAGAAFGSILIRGIRASRRARRSIKTHGHS